MFWIFLSTLPQGERHYTSVTEANNIEHFYPRSRKGSDPGNGHRKFWPHHFYPRSRKGSDVSSVGCMNSKEKFLSTLPQGERPAHQCNAASLH